MKTLNLIIFVVFAINYSFSQTKTIVVNKLVDIELGMTYESLIQKYPNPTDESKTESKIEMYFETLELSNGIICNNLLLSFYKNKLYDITTEYSNSIHLGLSNKYGYKKLTGMNINGYYGTSYKGNIIAVYIENKIIITDQSKNKEASSEGF